MRKGFGFAGVRTIRDQNQVLAVCFGLHAGNETWKLSRTDPLCGRRQHLQHMTIGADKRKS